jgi:hypothetical protein
MSRVERRERNEQWDATERRRPQPADRTPSKAEGDEETVREALRNSEKQREDS